MDFKEAVKVYLEACKSNDCKNSDCKKASVYVPGERIQAIKPFDAVRKLIELGIPKAKATEAVSKAIADRSKIESITNRICCKDYLYEDAGRGIAKAVKAILLAAAIGGGGALGLYKTRQTYNDSFQNGIEAGKAEKADYERYGGENTWRRKFINKERKIRKGTTEADAVEKNK